MSLLTVQDLSHAFRGLHAISNFNLVIRSGEIIGVIGPNGAGKTTLFNVLCGIYPVQRGVITLDHAILNGQATEQITRAGIARTFQNIRLFKQLSVLNNIKIAMGASYNLMPALIRPPLIS